MVDPVGRDRLYGYFPHSSKSHILTKSEHADKAKEIFEDTGITISAEGRCYLGELWACTTPFMLQFIERKVEEWTEEVKVLSEFTITQPHAAYAAFTHGLSSRWNYLLRVTNWEAHSMITTELLDPLETVIRSQFI